MGVIQTIIDQLSDTSIPLTNPLTATKVLAVRVGNQELINWINSEIEGYYNSTKLPSYRIYEGIVECDFTNGSYKMSNHIMPTEGLSKDLKSYVKDARFIESVEALEGLLVNDPEGNLIYPYPAEIVGILQANFRKISPSNRNIQLFGARRKISKYAIKMILSSVRNKLLDFMLKLETEFGDNAGIQELKENNQQITIIMSQTITTTGDGNIINTGDNANIKATINITKGNKDELIRYLDSIGINSEDTGELINVIDDDSQDDQNQSYGSKVSEWIGKMITKAASGVWSVGIGVAGSLLETGIKAYYGW